MKTLAAVLVAISVAAATAPAAQAGGVEEPHFGFKATGEFFGLDNMWPAPQRGLVAVNRADLCVQTEVPEGETVIGVELHRGHPGASRMLAAIPFDNAPSAGASRAARLTGPKGCVARSGLSKRMLRQLRERPRRFFIEVDTTGMPWGAYGGRLRNLRGS